MVDYRVVSNFEKARTMVACKVLEKGGVTQKSACVLLCAILGPSLGLFVPWSNFTCWVFTSLTISNTITYLDVLNPHTFTSQELGTELGSFTGVR